MKNLKIVFPLLGSKVYQFLVPDLSSKKNTKAQMALKLLQTANLIVFILFLFSIPFAYFFYGQTFETATFKYLILFVITNITLFTTTVILNGKKRIIDPEGFLGLLFFALTITTSSVIVSNAGGTNTFGVNTLRSTSGLMIMLVIGLFYITSLLVRNTQFFKRSISALGFGLLAYCVYILLSGDSIVLSSSILYFFLAFIFMLFRFIYAKKFNIVYLLISVLLFTYLLTSAKALSLSAFDIFTLIFSFAVAFISIYIVFIIINKKFVISRLKEIRNIVIVDKKGKIDIEGIFNKIIFIAFLILPLILVIYILITYIQNNLFVFSDIINGFMLNIKALVGTTFDLKTFVFGFGPNSYDPTNSFITNILLVQGTLSLFAYVAMFAYGIFKSLNLLAKTIKKTQDYKVVALLSTLLIFIPVLSLFVYPGLFTIFVWWFAFSLVCAYETVNRKGDIYMDKKEDYQIKGVLFKNKTYGKVGFYIRYVLVLVTILIGALLAINLIALIK